MPVDQGGPKRHALGVDFGTSNTVAVARWPDGRARPLLVDGSPLLPSAVYAEPDGTLAVGRDAVHSSRLDPARFEPNPKRRIDDGLVLLGDRELPVEDLMAAVLARVAEEWRRAVGPVEGDVTLTCPATWGAARRTLLAKAAARAGLENARLVAEPVAAATYFAEVLGRDVPIGSVVVVHDFGAGTFDASVVARTSSGFEVMAVDGRDDIGGLDVDAAIIEHLRTDDWQRVLEPTTIEERRAQRQLRDDARIAKERLSRSQTADFVVPLLDVEVHLTRDELERVARPVLDQTVRVTKGLLDWADLPPGRLAGVFLVGGASRIPLVATLLHRELDEAPVVIEQPELVVAEGSVLADAALLATGPAAPGPTAELRLISAGRAETATVRVAAAPATPSGLTGLQPPVDPWPDADHGSWVPDPQATVATNPPVPASGPPAAYGRATSAPLKPTVPFTPSSPRPARPQPVPPQERSRPAPPDSPLAPSRPQPGSQPPPRSRPAPPRSQPSPPRSQPVPKKSPQAPRKQKRRRGGFARFLRFVFSVFVMIAVPLLALLLAYGYGNGESLPEDAVNLIDDIRKLLGI
jgi:actin-like ATPase involved in cell morphogenesis